jgi:hypothetical protein
MEKLSKGAVRRPPATLLITGRVSSGKSTILDAVVEKVKLGMGIGEGAGAGAGRVRVLGVLDTAHSTVGTSLGVLRDAFGGQGRGLVVVDDLESVLVDAQMEAEFAALVAETKHVVCCAVGGDGAEEGGLGGVETRFSYKVVL